MRRRRAVQRSHHRLRRHRRHRNRHRPGYRLPPLPQSPRHHRLPPPRQGRRHHRLPPLPHSPRHRRLPPLPHSSLRCRPQPRRCKQRMLRPHCRCHRRCRRLRRPADACHRHRHRRRPPRRQTLKLRLCCLGTLNTDRTDRTDADVLQSVLDRLRQEAEAGSTTPPQPRVQPQSQPQPEPQLATRAPDRATYRPAQVGPDQRLGLARAALLSGKVDAARQYLEEAQLQLVFHPTTPCTRMMRPAPAAWRVTSPLPSACWGPATATARWNIWIAPWRGSGGRASEPLDITAMRELTAAPNPGSSPAGAMPASGEPVGQQRR